MSWTEVLLVFLRAAFLSMNGSTTLALLQEDLVDRLHILTPSVFATGLVIGSASPGPLGYGCIALGFLADGWRGALVATFTSWLPAFLAIPVRKAYARLEGQPWVQGVGWGVAAAGTGLLLAMAAGLARSAVTAGAAAGPGGGWRAAALGLALLILLFRRLPIPVVLLIGAASGALFLR